ncbi:hypothetical protein [Endozoicomonas atrinae]|uniref:hypothetical protein n=1 Tax=Endozoicomonas atrinae TaxID=1333660 RepID=UPI003B00AFB2
MQQPSFSGSHNKSVSQYDHRSLAVVGADKIQGMLPRCPLNYPIDGGSMPRAVEKQPAALSIPAGIRTGPVGHCYPKFPEVITGTFPHQLQQPVGRSYSILKSALGCVPQQPFNPQQTSWLEGAYQYWRQVSQQVQSREIQSSSMFLGVSPQAVKGYFEARARQDASEVGFPYPTNQASHPYSADNIVEEPTSGRKKNRKRKAQDGQLNTPANKSSRRKGVGGDKGPAMPMLSPKVSVSEVILPQQALHRAAPIAFFDYHQPAITPISPPIAENPHQNMAGEEVMAAEPMSYSGDFASTAVNPQVSVNQGRLEGRYEMHAEEAVGGFRPLAARSYSYPTGSPDVPSVSLAPDLVVPVQEAFCTEKQQGDQLQKTLYTHPSGLNRSLSFPFASQGLNTDCGSSSIKQQAGDPVTGNVSNLSGMGKYKHYYRQKQQRNDLINESLKSHQASVSVELSSADKRPFSGSADNEASPVLQIVESPVPVSTPDRPEKITFEPLSSIDDPSLRSGATWDKKVEAIINAMEREKGMKGAPENA